MSKMSELDIKVKEAAEEYASGVVNEVEDTGLQVGSGELHEELQGAFEAGYKACWQGRVPQPVFFELNLKSMPAFVKLLEEGQKRRLVYGTEVCVGVNCDAAVLTALWQRAQEIADQKAKATPIEQFKQHEAEFLRKAEELRTMAEELDTEMKLFNVQLRGRRAEGGQ
jgi:hypothetical protein